MSSSCSFPRRRSVSPVRQNWYTELMKITRLIFLIAAIIVAAWLVSLVFKFAAWLINGLVYVAAIVIIIGLISAYIESRKKK